MTTDLLKESIRLEKEKKRPVAFSELSVGDKIKHPTWGVLEYRSRTGSVNNFWSGDYKETISMVDFGTKFRRV